MEFKKKNYYQFYVKIEFKKIINLLNKKTKTSEIMSSRDDFQKKKKTLKTIADTKNCPNFIFSLILSTNLSINFKSRLHIYFFFAHSPFNS